MPASRRTLYEPTRGIRREHGTQGDRRAKARTLAPHHRRVPPIPARAGRAAGTAPSVGFPGKDEGPSSSLPRPMEARQKLVAPGPIAVEGDVKVVVRRQPTPR